MSHRLPRDMSGRELGRRLERLGYRHERQSGSHMRYRDAQGHCLTIPDHPALKAGTLSAILRQVALQQGRKMEEIRRLLLAS